MDKEKDIYKQIDPNSYRLSSVAIHSNGSAGSVGSSGTKTFDGTMGAGGSSSAAFKRVIVCAALKYQDLVIPCVKHYDHYAGKIIALLGDKLPQTAPPDIVKGFLDNLQNFLTAKEALTIATNAGQILKRTGKEEIEGLSPDNLY